MIVRVAVAMAACGATTVAQHAWSIEELAERLRVSRGGELVTEHRWADTSRPYLYPVIGPGGVALTRAWPIEAARAGEASDHPHHRSFWFAHGDVNGHDFWSEADGAGRIVHRGVLGTAASKRGAMLRTANDWIAANGDLVCRDERTLTFTATDAGVAIDHEITLIALAGEVRLGDTKEGTLALRLHPALRLSGAVANGTAINSEGIGGADIWGKRARWVDYSGTVDARSAGVAIFDHPANHAHPTWWHARAYGLFAANPFGVHDFEEKPAGTGEVVLAPGERLTLRHRVWLHGPEADLAASYDAYSAGQYLVLEDFDTAPALQRWAFSDPTAWRWQDGALELYRKSDYRPPVRSPHNIALLADRQLGDFALEATIMQTGREYGHRDLCLFFGFEGAQRYYYVHLASAADQNAHNVFLVDRAARRPIASRTTDGVEWGDEQWHRVRLERTLADGAIRVFFDDMTEPIMVAEDRTLGFGHVGFGSFDDVGRIDDLQIDVTTSRVAEVRPFAR